MKRKEPKPFPEALNFVVDVMSEVAMDNFESATRLFKEGIKDALILRDSLSSEEIEYTLAGLEALINFKIQNNGSFPNRTKPLQSICSFCGKDETAVVHLIAGPNVFICDICVGICNEVLSTKGKSGGVPSE